MFGCFSLGLIVPKSKKFCTQLLFIREITMVLVIQDLQIDKWGEGVDSSLS